MRKPVGDVVAEMRTRLRAVHAALDEALAESSPAHAEPAGPRAPGPLDAATLTMGQLELASLEHDIRELRTLQGTELRNVDAWIRRIPLSPSAELAAQALERMQSHRAAAEQLGRELEELEAALAEWRGLLGEERS